MRSISKPKFETAEGSDNKEAIPWPKIEGSLPIQSPTSVSPKDIVRERSKSVYSPMIVEYKRRNSQLPNKKIEIKKRRSIKLEPASKKEWIKRIKSPRDKNPQTIVLKVPTSESDSKDENSESEETQKQDTLRELPDLKTGSKRPDTKERSSRKLEYIDQARNKKI